MNNTQKLIAALDSGEIVTPDSYREMTGSSCLSQTIGRIRKLYGYQVRGRMTHEGGKWFKAYRAIKA